MIGEDGSVAVKTITPSPQSQEMQVCGGALEGAADTNQATEEEANQKSIRVGDGSL